MPNDRLELTRESYRAPRNKGEEVRARQPPRSIAGVVVLAVEALRPTSAPNRASR